MGASSHDTVHLSVSLRSVTGYLSDVEKQMREERKERIFNMWMACATQEEIAEAVGVHKDTVSAEMEVCRNLETLPNSDKVTAMHQDADFAPPIYNVWTFAKSMIQAVGWFVRLAEEWTVDRSTNRSYNDGVQMR